MERMTFKTLFYIMKTRVSKNGEVPVLLRVTVNGLRAVTTTNLKVNPDLWHNAIGKSLGTDQKNEELNNTLDVIKVNKYLKNFKKIIRIALANEWIKKDPFANIKFHLDEVEPDFLEDHEIHKIIEKPITIERLAIVRDTFIFCCFIVVVLIRNMLYISKIHSKKANLVTI